MAGSGEARAEAFWEQADHDLRQPIQSLQLLADAIARQAGTDTLRRAAMHTQAMIRDLTTMQDALLRLRRLESGRLAVRASRTDLVDLAAEAADEVREAVPELVLQVEGRARARADEAWLRPILRGLFFFAAIHRQDGGILIEMDDLQAGATIDIRFMTRRPLGRAAEKVFIEPSRAAASPVIALGPGFATRACQSLGWVLDLRLEGGQEKRVRLVLPRDGS